MMIVQVNYTRPAMPKAEWEARYTDDRARQFLSVPGLQWKIWLDGEEERRAGGIYLFDTREHAQRYLDMHAQRLTQAGVRNIRSRIYAVNAALTAINQGPVA